MGKRSRFFLLILLFLIFGLVLKNPMPYAEGAINGLNLVTYKVFPSLFPCFILIRLLTMLGAGYYLSKVLEKPITFFYKSPNIGGYIMALSMLSGYPIGAQLVAESVESKQISKGEAMTIMSFTSTSGPMFIISTIGVQLINNYRAGIAILVAHFLSSFLNGFIYRSGSSKKDLVSYQFIDLSSSLFSQTIYDAIISMLRIAGSIIFLNIICVVFEECHIINFAVEMLERLGLENVVSKGVVYGLLEITKGVDVLSKSSIPIKDMIVPISVVVSFGGLSIFVQSMTFLGRVGISGRFYLTTKVSQAIICYFVATMLKLILF